MNVINLYKKNTKKHIMVRLQVKICLMVYFCWWKTMS